MEDDDVSLPKATVYKTIQDYLPPQYVCTKDTKDLIVECCKEYVLAISSEANEICEKDSKKTMNPEHIFSALRNFGLERFLPDLEDVANDHKNQARERQKRASRMQDSGLSQEELLLEQERLFAQSRARYEDIKDEE